MNRLHIHVTVEDIAKAVPFYSALFGAEPTKSKDDYAKWMLDDPRLNFAISTGTGETGLNHLGIQGSTLRVQDDGLAREGLSQSIDHLHG